MRPLRAAAVAAVLLTTTGAIVPGRAVAATPARDTRPNIVLILTDDMTVSDLAWMPITKRVIAQFTRVSHPAPPKAIAELTERELDVFRLVARGKSNAEIGQELFISETTVKTHITHILQKLHLRDRVQAVVLAYESGLFEADAKDAGGSA